MEARVSIGNLAKKWAKRLLNSEGISRHDKAAIASMISHAPSVDLLPTLRQLLDDNLVSYHNFREAAKASRWRDDASVQEAQNPHMHEYQSALISIRAPETFDLAVGYLTNEHFGEYAARVIAVHWSEAHEPVSERRFMGGVDFSLVNSRYAARQADPSKSCPEAEEIFAAVDTLITEGTTEEQRNRAVILGSIGARLPHGSRAATIDKLIALAPRQSRAKLLLGLVMSGEDIPIDLVAKGIDETFEAAKTKAWILTDGNAYQLKDWLRLLPFSTPVRCIPKIIAGIPDGQRNPQMLEEMVRGLGQSPHEDCKAVLFKLAEDDPRFYRDHQWRQTLMGLGGEDTAHRIINLILSGAMDGTSHDERHWRDELANLLKKHPEARRYVHDLLKDGPASELQEFFAHVLARNPTPEDVIPLVKVEMATKRHFLDARSLEKAVTVHVASKDGHGEYEVVPVEATAQRRELLDLTTNDGREGPAARCLTEIDEIRDRYGAPEAEPRHPDFSSGSRWPILASEADTESIGGICSSQNGDQEICEGS